jgi:hypothetical protein
MIPAREALRATFDAVVDEIDNARGSQQLTNAFYAKIGNAIFDACYGALEHSEASGGTLQALSAPPGRLRPDGHRKDLLHHRLHHCAGSAD